MFRSLSFANIRKNAYIIRYFSIFLVLPAFFHLHDIKLIIRFRPHTCVCAGLSIYAHKNSIFRILSMVNHEKSVSLPRFIKLRQFKNRCRERLFKNDSMFKNPHLLTYY